MSKPPPLPLKERLVAGDLRALTHPALCLELLADPGAVWWRECLRTSANEIIRALARHMDKVDLRMALAQWGKDHRIKRMGWNRALYYLRRPHKRPQSPWKTTAHGHICKAIAIRLDEVAKPCSCWRHPDLRKDHTAQFNARRLVAAWSLGKHLRSSSTIPLPPYIDRAIAVLTPYLET